MIKIHDSTSCKLTIKYRVPQVTTLSSVLFNIQFNYIKPLNLNSSYMYAD